MFISALIRRMTSWQSRGRRYALTATALVILACGVAGGYGLSRAGVQTSSPVLFCANPFTGAVQHVQTAAQCVGGQLLEINREGPPGPEGPQGPAGPEGVPESEGPRGPQEPPGGGIDSFRRVAASATLEPGTGASVSAHCEDGEIAISGGFDIFTSPLEILKSRVTVDSITNLPDGWSVLARNPNDATVELVVEVICAA